MPIYESVEIRKSIDNDTTFAGEVVMTLDENGLVLAEGVPLSIDGHVIPSGLTLTHDLLAASVDTYIHTVTEGRWQVDSAVSMISVTGGAAAAVTVMVCTATQLPAAGTAQLTAVLDLEETAPSQKVGILIASPTVILPGFSVALDFSGTLTGLVGSITVKLKKLS